jgi:sec-independent protein translocase protein TatA
MFRNPTTDLIIVLVVVLVIFGPKRIPMIGRELGRGMREFKDSITGNSKDEDEDDAERPAITSASAQQEGVSATPAQPGSVPSTDPAAARQQEPSVPGGSEHRS